MRVWVVVSRLGFWGGGIESIAALRMKGHGMHNQHTHGNARLPIVRCAAGVCCVDNPGRVGGGENPAAPFHHTNQLTPD